MAEIIELTTTIGSKEEAELLAHDLVEQRLTACVQISGPITSIYRWSGNVHQAPEWKLTIKTSQRLMEETFEAILAKHPYEVPEILCHAVGKVHEAYERWLDESLRP